MEDESLNFVGRIAQKAIIENDGAVLLMRNRGRDVWELPGGRLHRDENPAQGLEREIFEELGLTVSVGLPLTTGTFILNRTGEPHFFVVYACTCTSDGPFVIAQDEVEEVRWFPRAEALETKLWDDYKHALEVFFKMREN